MGFFAASVSSWISRFGSGSLTALRRRTISAIDRSSSTNHAKIFRTTAAVFDSMSSFRAGLPSFVLRPSISSPVNP
jgi:hypothetical protein